jgi:uncharacterized membrane protein
MSIAYFYVGMAVLLTAVGQLLYKLYFIKKNRAYVIGAVATFIAVPAFNYLALATLSIDVVYMATALTVILVMLASYLFLNEHINRKQVIGTILITIGIIVYNL